MLHVSSSGPSAGPAIGLVAAQISGTPCADVVNDDQPWFKLLKDERIYCITRKISRFS